MPASTQKATVPKGRWVWLALITGFVCLFWLGLRTAPVVRQVLLAEASRHGLQTEWVGLGPCGLWSVCATELRVTGLPAMVDQVVLRDVRLTPRWPWIVRRTGSPGRVRAGAIDVRLLMTDGGSGADTAAPDGLDVAALRTTASRSLPSVELASGTVVIEDANGLYPRVEVTLERLQGSMTERGYRVDGLVRLSALGRALIHGEILPDESPHLAIRMLEDNDVFELLTEAGAVDGESTFSLGSIDVQWPPRVTVSPVSVRRLSMTLPGFNTWQLENIWASRVEAWLEPGGYVVEFADLRVRLQGLLRSSDVRADMARWSHNHQTGQSTWQANVVDEAGDSLTITASHRDHHMALAASSLGINVSALTPLLSAEGAAVVSGGLFAGQVQASWDRARDTWLAEGRFAVDGVRLGASWLAATPVPLGRVAVGGRWRYERPAGTLWVEDALVESGDIGLQVNLHSYDDGQGRVDEIRVSLAPAGVAQVMQSVPIELLGALSGATLTGRIEGELQTRVSRARPTESTVALEVRELEPILWQGGGRLDLSQLLAAEGRIALTDEFGEAGNVGPGVPGWVPLSQVPAWVWRSIVAAEDDAFFQHTGFDVRGIEGALRANLEAGRFVRGGSTITQQLVKNLFLTRERSFGRKLQEVVLTALVEGMMTKEEILEWYINVVSWGQGVRGIDGAARSFFGHGAAALTLRESVFLAAILPNPAVFGRQYVEGDLEEGRRVKMRNILINLERAGVIDPSVLASQGPLVLSGQVSNARGSAFAGAGGNP
jgi:hypothetical protein